LTNGFIGFLLRDFLLRPRFTILTLRQAKILSRKNHTGGGCVRCAASRPIKISTGKKLVLTLSLNPAFSPRRRRIICRVFGKPVAGFAGRSSAEPETSDYYSFSPGEKVRLRAGKHHFNFAFPAPEQAEA
jgi:hypothetical protein